MTTLVNVAPNLQQFRRNTCIVQQNFTLPAHMVFIRLQALWSFRILIWSVSPKRSGGRQHKFCLARAIVVYAKLPAVGLYWALVLTMPQSASQCTRPLPRTLCGEGKKPVPLAQVSDLCLAITCFRNSTSNYRNNNVNPTPQAASRLPLFFFNTLFLYNSLRPYHTIRHCPVCKTVP